LDDVRLGAGQRAAPVADREGAERERAALDGAARQRDRRALPGELAQPEDEEGAALGMGRRPAGSRLRFHADKGAGRAEALPRKLVRAPAVRRGLELPPG